MYTSAANARAVFGLTTPESRYKQFWESQGFVAWGREPTASIQSAMRNPETRKKYEGFMVRGYKAMMEQMEAKQVTTTTVASAIPLVFDPDVLDIVHSAAPFLARLAMRGYAGDPIRVNPIVGRDAPVGYISETASLNLFSQSREFTLDPIDYSQKIYADRVTIGDFAERVSAGGPIDLRETAIGQRIAAWAQHKEKAILYGDHSKALTDGSPGDANCFDGMSVNYTIPSDLGASNVVDKAAVNLADSQALLKDIKAEIKSLLMTTGVSTSDLEVWTSHTLFDELENEMQVRAVLDQRSDSATFGYKTLTIADVPVVGGHNIRQHAFDPNGAAGGPYVVGSEGDVFINNMRASLFGGCAPLFMMPLGKQGFAEEVALGEYGTYIDRAGGRFGKYLRGYNI